MNIRSWLGSSAKMVKGLIIPSFLVGNAVINHDGMQEVQQLNDSTAKNKIINAFANGSSLMHLGAITVSAMGLAESLLTSGVWSQLSIRQRLYVAGLTVVASGWGICSIALFGAEDSTLLAGSSAGVSSLMFFSTKEYAQSMVAQSKENALDSSDSQPRPESMRMNLMNPFARQ